MASIMDMLADVPFEEADDSINNEEEGTANKPENGEPVKSDLFDLSNEEDENNDSNNLHCFYTEPIVIENSASKTNKSKARSVTTLMKKAVLDDTTAADHDTDGDDVTGVDLSQPQPEDSSSQNEQEEITSQTEVEKTKYDPDNPDPDGPKYCHCRWGESGVMVECEECKEWYHDECIGLTEEETYNVETYYCAPCCSTNSELVTRYTEDPVKLRSKILEKIREEDSKLKKTKKRKKSGESPKTPKTPKLKSVKSVTPKATRTPKLKTPKPKRIAQTERKPPRKNKLLNKSLPTKPSPSKRRRSSSAGADSSGDDFDKVAFVICEECGDSFPSKNALARHARKHEEKPEVRYECDECGKKFGTAKSLRDHEVIHSGVKPFSCMFCGEAFYLMSQLTTHTNSKHLNVRHQCEHCNRSYSNKPSLSLHMKKVHGELADSD